MTHAEMVNVFNLGPHHAPKNTNTCHAELNYAGYSDHGGTEWIIFHCPSCNRLVYSIGGGRHWRNYTEGGER
jgi:hypothetical protein